MWMFLNLILYHVKEELDDLRDYNTKQEDDCVNNLTSERSSCEVHSNGVYEQTNTGTLSLSPSSQELADSLQQSLNVVNYNLKNLSL